MSNAPATQQGDRFTLATFDSIKDRCEQLLGSDRFMKEASFAIQIIGNSPQLQKATRASIVGAMLNVANTGLTLNPVLKLAYLIPRNAKVRDDSGRDFWETRCYVEPSYMGLMKLATDTGSVRHFESFVVYKGDLFEFDLVNRRPTKHVPYWSLGADRGPIVGCYGIATLTDGSTVVEHMGADELLKIRSKSDNKAGSVYTDWEGEMARKAVLKRLAKYVPKSDRSEAFLAAMDIDNESFNLTLPETTESTKNLDVWKQRLVSAFEFYQGEDKEALREQCREKIGAGEFTEAFARNVLEQMGEKHDENNG